MIFVPPANRSMASATGWLNRMVAIVLFSVALIPLVGAVILGLSGSPLLGLLALAVAFLAVTTGRESWRASRIEQARHQAYLAKHPSDGKRRPRHDPEERAAIQAAVAAGESEEWDLGVQENCIAEAEAAGPAGAAELRQLRSEAPAATLLRLGITRPAGSST